MKLYFPLILYTCFTWNGQFLTLQATLAQRRSNFQGNQFPLAAEHARKAFVAPIRNKSFNQNKARNVTTPR